MELSTSNNYAIAIFKEVFMYQYHDHMKCSLILMDFAVWFGKQPDVVCLQLVSKETFYIYISI